MEGGSGPSPSLAAVHRGRLWSSATGWLWRRRPTAARLDCRELRRWLVPGLGASAQDGLSRAQMGSSGPSSSTGGFLGGGGDDLAGSRDGGSVASLFAAGCPELYMPIWAWSGAGAWLTWENVIDVGASYSSSPCQQHQKIPYAW
jgi:hypothetical protein